MWQKCSYSTSKPDVTETPILAWGCVFTIFLLAQLKWWRDQSDIMAMIWKMTSFFQRRHRLLEFWMYKFAFQNWIIKSQSQSGYVAKCLVVSYTGSAKPMQIISLMCKNWIEKWKFEKFMLKSFVHQFFLQQNLKEVWPSIIEAEYYSCLVQMIPTIMFLIKLELIKFATNINELICKINKNDYSRYISCLMICNLFLYLELVVRINCKTRKTQNKKTYKTQFFFFKISKLTNF